MRLLLAGLGRGDLIRWMFGALMAYGAVVVAIIKLFSQVEGSASARLRRAVPAEADVPSRRRHPGAALRGFAACGRDAGRRPALRTYSSPTSPFTDAISFSES